LHKKGRKKEMQKSKKIIALLMTVIMLTQIFSYSGMAFGNDSLKNNSAMLGTSGSSTLVSNDVKSKESTAKNGTGVISTADPTANVTAVTTAQQLNGTMVSKDMKKSNKKSSIIVKYKDINKAENSKNKFTTKKPKSKITSKKAMKSFKMEALEISSDDDISDIINDLQSDPNVVYAQPDYVLDTYLIPSDVRYSEQWGFSNNGQAVNGQAGTPGIDIDIENAWNLTTGSNEVTIGIVDTGVDLSHPEISGNIYVNEKEQLDGVDNDGNGYIDDVTGFDFVNKDRSVFDSASKDRHATHIAGIIASGMNNGGIAGVSPNVKILPLKFIDGNSGYTSDAISAIEYGISMGVSIFNCSWGGSQQNQALKDIMENSNALFICAAGNAGQNVDINPVYPACYQLPNVISVGAIDNRGQLASFSNYGSKVQIVAPGVDILSTLPGNNYGLMSGTSMAAPFVTGVAALLKSKYPTMSAAEIKAGILNNATYMQNLAGKVSTSGRLNASAALLNNTQSYTVQPTAEPTPTLSPVFKSKEPGPIYDISAGGNNKIPKPVMSDRNLFIDSAIKTGMAKTSSDNGIENLGLFRIKEKFVTVIWTTDVEANTMLHYGNTEGVEKVYTSNKLTKKHQAEIMVESIDDIRYFMAKSISQNGTEFDTDIKAAADYMKDLGGNAPVFPDTVLSSNETSLSDVSTMSYIIDNGANHSFDTTQQIYQGTLFGTADESAGSDYYRIFLSAGKTYSIDLIGMAEGEDYDVYLYDNTRNILGVSNIGGNYDEEIEYTTTEAGMYYLQVMPYTYSSTSAHHNYQLVVYSQDCPPDSYEPNDGRLVATPITAGNTIAATINVNTDEDWFVLDTAKIGKLNVTLKSIPTDCDYDLEVYESDGTTLIDGSYSSSCNDEKITKIINETGKYYIRVYNGTGSNAFDTYELQANVYTPDGYELNDEAYNVKNTGEPSIDLGSCTSATIDNPDDTDFFKFTVGSDTNVGVRLQNIPEGMDYDLAVYSYDSSTNNFLLVSSSTYGGNSDETVVSQLAAGFYYIKVYSYCGSSETQSYMLSVTDENAGIVKIDFDKTSAAVGEIITATLSVDSIDNFAGYQVNLKYDPEVIQPVDDSLQPYSEDTKPTGTTVINNSNYSPVSYALNDLSTGTINFCAGYLNLA
jgi:subtilisin family serine protease